MAGKSDYLENKTLDHTLGGPDYARAGTVYFELYTSAPTDAGGGTPVSGGSYGRIAYTNNATNWPAAVAGVKSNAAAINFAVATAVWGTVVAVGIFDASSGGNLLYWNNLSTPRLIGTGDSYSLPIGSVVITED